MKPAHPLQGIGVRTRGVLLVGCAALALAGIAVAEDQAPLPARAPTISQEQAKAIALQAMPGKVTDVTIEKKRGQTVYVVEIRTESQGERDVFIDMQSGQVVGTD